MFLQRQLLGDLSPRYNTNNNNKENHTIILIITIMTTVVPTGKFTPGSFAQETSEELAMPNLNCELANPFAD